MSNEKISSIIASNYPITPKSNYFGNKIRVKLNGICLKLDKITYNHRKMVNIYIIYEISKNFPISSYPALESCLFGALCLTKNNDIDKYKYSRYGIGFDKREKFSVRNGFGRNCIIVGADISSSVNANNKTKIILVLREGFRQGLEDITL